jgi:hypothetical protein
MKRLKITTYWTAEEAHCVYQLLDELKSAVWESYGEDILKMFNEIQLEQQKNEDNGNSMINCHFRQFILRQISADPLRH